MRILFSSSSAYGHIIPLLPLARAFRARGDEVALMVSAESSPLVDGEDITVLAAGASKGEVIAAVERRLGRNPLDGVTAEMEAEVFAGIMVDLAADDALEAAGAWKPDLVVREQADFVGASVSAALEVPLATHAFGPAQLPEDAARLASVFQGRLAARGLTPTVPRWHVDPCPPLLQVDSWQPSENRLAMRPEAYRKPGGAAQAPLAGRHRTRPRVLVTFGTVFSSAALLTPLLRELALADVDIVATTGLVAKRDDFDVDAGKVTLVEFTPLGDLLRDVDAVVTHGGAGSVLGTLASGLPMVVIPQGAGQDYQAERVAAAGAGIALLPEEAAPARVAAAMATILEQHSYRDAARAVAQQIAALPSAADVASGIADSLR